MTEAQLQDAIRNQIDNLYTVYVDAVAAGLTVRFSQVCLTGDQPAAVRLRGAGAARRGDQADVDVCIRAQLEQAQLQVRESSRGGGQEQAGARAAPEPAAGRGRRSSRSATRSATSATLPSRRRAWSPRASAPARPAGHQARRRPRRGRRQPGKSRTPTPTSTLLYQPYTFQNNTYLGVKSAYSCTLGVTATVPLYNRNQGNIRRAKINVGRPRSRSGRWSGHVVQRRRRTRSASSSRAGKAVIEQEEKIVPAVAEVRDAAGPSWQGGRD